MIEPRNAPRPGELPKGEMVEVVFKGRRRAQNGLMTPQRFNGQSPLLVGVMPNQHPEVLTTAANLAARMSAPLLCAYVDEASYLVEWDPARSAHRLSLHPGQDDEDVRAVTADLNAAIERTVADAGTAGVNVEWTLRTLSGDLETRFTASIAATAPVLKV